MTEDQFTGRASACSVAPPAIAVHIAESLLRDLATREPRTAYIAAGLLSASGNGDGALMAAALMRGIPLEAAVNPSETPRAVDILVLAVKHTELRAVLRAFDVDDEQPILLQKSGICAWLVSRDGLDYAIAMVGTAGNVEAAGALSDIYSVLRFRAAVMVGMAAGVRGPTRLGDVVVSEFLLAYEFQRMTTRGPSYLAKSYSAKEPDLRAIDNLRFKEPGWVANMLRAADSLTPDFPQDEDEPLGSWSPSTHRGGILAGGQLLEDGSLPKLRKRFHDRVLAAEMEGVGFANACGRLEIEWLVVRGIADYGEAHRRKHWQLPATFAAAVCVRRMLAHRLLFSRLWEL